MELDLFSPLTDSPMTVEQIASVLKVNPAKIKPLLYALGTAELLTVDGEFFSKPQARKAPGRLAVVALSRRDETGVAKAPI